MKLALSLTLSFLLFAFVTKLPLAFSNDCEPVLDINGNPICPGGKYYIIPAIRDPPGGGLRLGNNSYSKCPLTVLQDYSEAVNGIPVRFSKPGRSCPCIIFTDTPLEIEFIERPNCAESSKWLGLSDDVLQIVCVGIGGPPDLTLSTTFSIQKHGSGYKLAFCGTGAAASTCIFDIGRIDNGGDEGGRRLCNRNGHEPYEVVFEDAVSYDEGFIRSVA